MRAYKATPAPKRHTVSACEKRAERRRSSQARGDKKIARALMTMARPVLHLADAEGRPVYDRETGASSININVPNGLLVPLMSRTAIAKLENKFGHLLMMKRFADAAQRLPDRHEVEVYGADTLGGPSRRSPDSPYFPALLLEEHTELLLIGDRASIYQAFGWQPSYMMGSIVVAATRNQQRAQVIENDLREQLAFPLQGTLGPVTALPVSPIRG